MAIEKQLGHYKLDLAHSRAKEKNLGRFKLFFSLQK